MFSNPILMKTKVLFFVLLLVPLINKAQEDSTKVSWPEYKNTIRYNLTPTLILGTGSWVFGYERMLKNERSFSVNTGHIQLPRILKTTFDSLRIETGARRNGVSFAADYRFYMKKRNKNKAPDGIYWGPYLTSYYFNSDVRAAIVDYDIVKSELMATTQLWTTMLGVEIGYQFVLGNKKRSLKR